ELGDEAGANALVITGEGEDSGRGGVAAQRHGEVMSLREIVLQEQQGAATHLAHDQIETAVIAEVGGDHAAAVAVVVRPRQVADIEEVLALDIEPGAIAFESAEIMPAAGDGPGIGHPEF